MFRTFGLVIILSATLTASRADDAAWGEVGGADLPATEQMSSEQTTAPSANEPACGEDDPRLENIIPVLKEIQTGNTIEPVQLSFETYMSLSPKVRSILGDNLYISLADCSKQFMFEGEFIESIVVPMPKIWSIIQSALRENMAEKLQFIHKNVKAAPESAVQIMGYIQDVKFPAAHHSLLKDHLFISPMKESPSAKEKPFFLLDIFIQLGGLLIPENVGENVYLVYYGSGDRVEGVYLDSGYANIVVPGYSPMVLSGILLQIGLNPIPIDKKKIKYKSTTWYQKFIEMNSI